MKDCSLGYVDGRMRPKGFGIGAARPEVFLSRVVLRGDVVQVESGSYAIFTE